MSETVCVCQEKTYLMNNILLHCYKFPSTVTQQEILIQASSLLYSKKQSANSKPSPPAVTSRLLQENKTLTKICLFVLAKKLNQKNNIHQKSIQHVNVNLCPPGKADNCKIIKLNHSVIAGGMKRGLKSRVFECADKCVCLCLQCRSGFGPLS